MKIKKNLEKEYIEYVEKNKDPYGKCAVDAGESVMKLLDEGKTCEESEKGLYGHDLTGFLAGCAISGVVKFHERGDEMKQWWNRNSGGDIQEDGVRNPAIITITAIFPRRNRNRNRRVYLFSTECITPVTGPSFNSPFASE